MYMIAGSVVCRSLASGSPMDEAECVSHLTNIVQQVRTSSPLHCDILNL